MVIPHEDEEPPMDMPPMDDSMSPMGPDDGSMPPPPDNNEPPMEPDDDSMSPPPGDDEPPMGPDDNGEEPPMGPDGGEGQNEIDDIFNSLGVEDQSAVLKYAKSMADDSSAQGDEGMPMEGRRSRLDYIIEDVLSRETRGKDRTCKRNSPDITNSTLDGKSPFQLNW